MRHLLQHGRHRRPSLWHTWVKTQLPAGARASYNKICAGIRNFVYPHRWVLLWLVGLVVQLGCLWLLHELVLLAIDLFEVWALLARKYLEITS